jgi:uncharacterized membrane protein
MNQLAKLWIRLRSSLWFLPTILVLASMAAAVALIESEGLVGDEMAQRWPRVFGASADGSREMLSAIATSMITVAGVVFSITIVALSLTSTQYSPRVLRNFMRDRPTQLVPGVFVGIFAYCLLVLRTIRGADELTFIPSLAVLVGMGYAFAGIAFLIYFIHHVAQSIQASSIVSRIFGDTAAAIDHLFPQELGTPPARHEALHADAPASWTCVKAQRSGYVTGIDSEGLLRFATEQERVLRLAAAPGDFVIEGATLVEASGSAGISDDHRRGLQRLVVLGRHRTVEQDAGFGLQQLVDVAVKALSPGINDPTTACMCVDQLGALLVRLAVRRMPDTHRTVHGRLRVIAPGPQFADLLGLAFGAVIRHSRGDLEVLGRLLAALAAVQGATTDAGRRNDVAAVICDVQRELRRVEPAIRAAGLRRRARDLLRGRSGSGTRDR